MAKIGQLYLFVGQSAIGVENPGGGVYYRQTAGEQSGALVGVPVVERITAAR